jgi:hypothetical protein
MKFHPHFKAFSILKSPFPVISILFSDLALYLLAIVDISIMS